MRPPDTIWVSSMWNTSDRKLSHWRIHLKSLLAPAEPGHDNKKKKSQAWRHLSSGSDLKHFPGGLGSAQPLPVMSARFCCSCEWCEGSPGSVAMPICGLFISSPLTVTLLRNVARQKFDSLASILALHERFLNSGLMNAVYMCNYPTQGWTQGVLPSSAAAG